MEVLMWISGFLILVWWLTSIVQLTYEAFVNHDPRSYKVRVGFNRVCEFRTPPQAF